MAFGLPKNATEKHNINKLVYACNGSVYSDHEKIPFEEEKQNRQARKITRCD